MATWLTERGYRTKQGKPFNPHAVLTMLRNRVYLGEVFFRGHYHLAPHEPLVDRDLFERAQEILASRGEDASLRRSNQSDYLLTGLVTCARCGKRYLGAAAHGNGGRYSYYVCFTRQRYGSTHCDSDRLPAPALEDAILERLVHVLDQEPLVRQAIADAFSELDAERPKREAEIKRIDAEIKRTNQTLERYFQAFEHGSMPEGACAPRITELTRKLAGLRARRDELGPDDTQASEPLSDQDLRALQAHARQVIETGDPPARKALLQALVADIRVVSREEIYPTFSLPTVRPPCEPVPPAGHKPNRVATVDGGRMMLVR